MGLLPKPRCIHCLTYAGRAQNRGLCNGCYMTSAIRRLYPVKGPNHLGVGHVLKHGKGRMLDPNPTNALPGSAEKVQVLIRRAQLGYVLFHPLDAVMANDDVALVVLACPLSGQGFQMVSQSQGV